MAYRDMKEEFAGVGALIQAIAVIAAIGGFAVLGAVGGTVVLVLALALFVVGHAKSRRIVCSDCRNPLASDEVKVCPACKARLD